MEESPLDAVDPMAVSWDIQADEDITKDEDSSRIRFTRRNLFPGGK